MPTQYRTQIVALIVLLLPFWEALAAQEHDHLNSNTGKTTQSTTGPGCAVCSLPGQAFDGGPRQRPQVITGIGQSHFPITAANAEVQKWFDQGNTLLHSYWFYEAERAFRWSLKLDPECAMCYWGMARVTSGTRRTTFIQEAAKRKDKVTPREKLYIETWEQRWAQDDGLSEEARQQRFDRALQEICINYPDDIEAKLLFANQHLGSKDAYAMDAVLQLVLAAAPRHPGALHYRIHLWDKKEPQYILSTGALYASIATSAGHGQHMVGHIFNALGMWHEAAIYMDTANRIDLQYMQEHMQLPVDWNYTHNRNALSFVQEELGMRDAAVAGARELLSVPLDPKYNSLANPDAAHWTGVLALVRALIKFERWDEILKPGNITWGSTLRDQVARSYCETLAWIGRGDLEQARKSLAAHAELKQQIEKPENKDLLDEYSNQSSELTARLAIASGDTVQGLALLAEAARRDLDYRKFTEGLNRGAVLYNVLGEAYLALHKPDLAADAFEKTLAVVRNDGFALSGLVNAYASLGKMAEARHAFARLKFVWSDADHDLKWLETAKQWKFNVQPEDESPVRQRIYQSTALEKFGPGTWQPYSSPRLDATDLDGQKVTWDKFRGKNKLLIFYPMGDCPKCLAQLVELGKRKRDFLQLDTEIVVVSGNTTASITELRKVIDPYITLLWDSGLEDAHRFHAYDDFAETSMNSILMIDRQNRVHWSREGGDPFVDYTFLLKELKQMNDMSPQ